MEHSARTPADTNFPCLENLERHHRRVHQVPQFMSEVPEAFAPAGRRSIDARLILSATVLSDRAGDGIVQAVVQRTKVFRGDRRVQFYRELGDGLTDVAVVVHDLRHGEALKQEIMSMLEGGPADLEVCRLAEA